jgi:hypothetical protein
VTASFVVFSTTDVSVIVSPLTFCVLSAAPGRDPVPRTG